MDWFLEKFEFGTGILCTDNVRLYGVYTTLDNIRVHRIILFSLATTRQNGKSFFLLFFTLTNYIFAIMKYIFNSSKA
jgi:hypothetical protein